MPLGAVGPLASAKQQSDDLLKAAKDKTAAAPDAASKATATEDEAKLKSAQATKMGAAVMAAAGGADIHSCTTPLPLPVHGAGVVITGSPTVLINNLPACRQGDQILEPVGPPNFISMGCPTVIIGDSAPGGQAGAMQVAARTGAPCVML
jgi:uncharacterized Zn-binding protein involved in type VI secretion